MEKCYAVKLSTDLSVEIVKCEGKLLDECYKHIGCEMIEMVRPKGLQYPYCMVVDEEFLLKNRPVINFIGSYLYETHVHGQPICGTVLVMARTRSNLRLLDREEAESLADNFKRNAYQMYLAITTACNAMLVYDSPNPIN